MPALLSGMHQSYNNGYSFSNQTSPRYSSSHSTSSAMSPSANPDEDWTKISDLAERRRIQNRIAQRNYRKKLKRRLEDLERRAGSSSASPEAPQHAVLASVPSHSQSRQQQSSSDASKKRRSKVEPAQQQQQQNRAYSHQLPQKEQPSMFDRQYTRQLSTSPPPTFTYTYPPMPSPPPTMHAPYPHLAGFHSLPTPYPDYNNGPHSSQSQGLYLPPVVTLPSMGNSYDNNVGMKSERGGYGGAEEEMMNQFQMGYGGQQAGDGSQGYADENAYTPPLSLSHSFDHSRATSPGDSTLICPGTPTSMNGLDGGVGFFHMG